MDIKHSRVYTAEFVDFVDKFTLSDKGFCRTGDNRRIFVYTFCLINIIITLVPEVFLEFSLRERAAKRRERKTSGYLGLESHFHADAGVMI